MHLNPSKRQQLVRLQVTRSSKPPKCTGPLTGFRATTLSAATIALALTGAAHAQQLSQAQSTVMTVMEVQRTAQSAKPLAGLHCFDRPYAPEKRLVSNQVPTERKPEEPEPNGDDIQENDGRIMLRDRELSVPPEIQRIRRGYVESFTGTFINDGLEHWDGVDLDRNLVVVVQRRIHDQRAALSRPFGDPTFPPNYHSGVIFGRKFANDLRTELEVISVLPIERGPLEAFICVANAAWAAAPQPPVMISDGFIVAQLLDEESQGQRRLSYRKSIYSEALNAVLERNLEQYVPQPTWK